MLDWLWKQFPDYRQNTGTDQAPCPQLVYPEEQDNLWSGESARKHETATRGVLTLAVAWMVQWLLPCTQCV